MNEPKAKLRRRKRTRLKTIPHKIRSITIIVSLFTLIFYNGISSYLSGRAIYVRAVRQVQTELNGISSSLEQTYTQYINKSLIFDNDPEMIQLLQAPFTDIKSSKNLTASRIQSDYQKVIASLVSEDPNILDYYLVNTTGTIYCSISKNMAGKNMANENYIEKITNGDSFAIDNLKYFTHLKSYGFAVSAPITYHNETIGVGVAILSANTFDKIIDLINVLHAKYYVTDCNGVIVYSNNKEEVGSVYPEDKTSTYRAPFVNDDTETKTLNIDNVSYMIKETSLSSSGWVIHNLTDKRSFTDAFMVQNRILFSFIILSCALAAIITGILFKPFSGSIKEILNTTNAIAAGDLSSRIPENTYSIEFHNLVKHVNLMAEKLSDMIQTTSNTISQVEESSTNLCSVSDKVQISANDINQKVSFIAAKATEQNTLSSNSTLEVTNLGTQIELLFEKNIEMIQYGEKMRNALDENNEMITVLTKESEQATHSSKEVSHQVSNLAAQFQKVSEIIGIIENISSQTNLLSLNASIEAARAGEAGRGFAVVASEIRGLSEEVQNSVNRISDIIRNVESITTDTQFAANESDRIVSDQVASYKEMQEKFITMAQSILDMKHLSDNINEYVVAVSNKKDIVLELMKQMADGSVEIENITAEATIAVDVQTKTFQEVNQSAEILFSNAQAAKKMIGHYTTKD